VPRCTDFGPGSRLSTPDPDTCYRQPIRLRDGRPALIRALRADDLGRIERAFAQLDGDTIYRRFFCYRKGLNDADRAAIADNDFVRRATCWWRSAKVTTGRDRQRAARRRPAR
jgi:hypothetical protein